ncbi:MAG: SdiA-regulated domain-containing protein [Candidatus Hydrothermarchaeota archaeon]
MKIRFFLLSALILLANCLPAKYSPTIRFPYTWLGNIDQQNFVEPSGICFHPLRKTLFVVSDEGKIVEMETDGTPVFNLKIPGDLEGVTVNPQSGLLYLIIEGEDIILEFDPDKKEVTRKFPVNREFQGDPNFLQKQEKDYDNGIESIAFISNENHPEGGTFYVGNQDDPPCIMEILVPLKSSQAETAEARITRVLPFKMDDPAAMYYDSKAGLLNVVSDADNILVEITLEGKLAKEYAFLGDNQEGLARDEEGYLYIAQDSGGIIKVKDLRK